MSWFRAGDFDGSLLTLGDGESRSRSSLVSIIQARVEGLPVGVVPRVSKLDIVETAVVSKVDYEDALAGFDYLIKDGILTPLGLAGSDEFLVNFDRLALE